MTTAVLRIVDDVAYWNVSVPHDKLSKLYGVPEQYSLRFNGAEIDSCYSSKYGGTLTLLQPVDGQLDLAYTSSARHCYIGVYKHEVLHSAVEIKFETPVNVRLLSITLDGITHTCNFDVNSDACLRIATTAVPIQDGKVSRDELSKLSYIVASSGQHVPLSL